VAMGSPVLAANGTPYALPSAAGILKHVPDELLPIIFSFLGPGGAAACMGVCRHWRFVARDELLWREFSRQACKLHCAPFPGAAPPPASSITAGEGAGGAGAGAEGAAEGAGPGDVWEEARLLAKSLRSWRAMVHRIPQPRYSGPYILRSAYFRKPWRDLWHDPPPFILCEYHRSFWFDPHGSVLCGNTAGDVRAAMRALRRARQSLADAGAFEHADADERRRLAAQADSFPPGVVLGLFRMRGSTVEVLQPVRKRGAVRWTLSLERDPRSAGSTGALLVSHVRIRDPSVDGRLSPAERRNKNAKPVLNPARSPRAWSDAVRLFHPALWTDDESTQLHLDSDTFDFLPAHRIV
jgi:F-box-like/F-box only protein C-terminal region